MFKNFNGFHLVESLHQAHFEEFFHPNKVLVKTYEAIFVIAVTLLLWNLPSTAFGIEGLNIVQQRIIAIFAFATLMWIFEIVPAWATSVAIIGMLLLFTSDSGIIWMCNEERVGELLSYKSVMATFADPVIMLFIGGFILAIAATKTGLDAQLAKALLKPFGKKSENVLLGFLLITGLFSMFVSNTATAAMMLTFLTPVFRQLPPEGKGRISLALSIPVAANLGGMGTPIGTPPNTIAIKYLNDPEGMNLNIGFGEWMLIMVLSGLVCYGLSNFISNSATAALLMPILTVVCAAMGDKLDAIGGTSTILIGVAIAASSAMVLPISTPPNALAYATNLVQQKHMAKIGLISGILSIILGYVMLYVIGTMHLI